MMIPSGTLCSFLIVMLVMQTRPMVSQINAAGDQGLPSYRLKVPVDEVSLSFHAADRHGLSVNDLKLEELKLLDNGRPPLQIPVFESFNDASIRAGILMDTS